MRVMDRSAATRGDVVISQGNVHKRGRKLEANKSIIIAIKLKHIKKLLVQFYGVILEQYPVDMPLKEIRLVNYVHLLVKLLMK